MSGGVFTTDGCVIGKIFADLNGNHVQNSGELGIPGVRLTFEDGTSLVSDEEGKYSYCGLSPTTHVLKVDRATLPSGARLTTSSIRNVGDAGSLFVDLKFGEVRRADFVEGSADPHVIAQIEARRARAESWMPTFDAAVRPTVVQRGRSANQGGSGQVGGFPSIGQGSGTIASETSDRFAPIGHAGPLGPANSNAPSQKTFEQPAGQGTPVAAPMGGAVADEAMVAQGGGPMLAVGLVEGIVSVSNVKWSALSPAQPGEAFDRALTRLSGSFDDGRGQYGGRGALFMKGHVQRNYLLTLAYDSEKDNRGVLFRDIQPESFYPVYGDASVKSFDAQTSDRFYARIERGVSYLMYGDLRTAAGSRETQQLGSYSRTLTGVQQHFENKRVLIKTFASFDSLRQVIDEIGGLGISGPYRVSNPNGVSGTEKVEIVTRDRNQPALILSAVPLTRFTDYEFEPFSGRLLFRRPVPSLDERLNPMSIRITYEVDSGGEKSWVSGGDGQLKIGPALQLGGSWAEDAMPGSPFRVRSVNGMLQLSKSTTLVAEGARTEGVMNTSVFNPSVGGASSQDAEGNAGRLELRHESGRLTARAFAATAEPGFSNPASTLAGGRTEAGGRATLAVNETMQVIGEALHSEDQLTGGRRQGGMLAVETKLSRAIALELGIRRVTETPEPAQSSSAGIRPFGLSGATGGFGFGPAINDIDPVSGLPLARSGFSPQLTAGNSAPLTGTPTDVMTLRAKFTVALGQRADVYGEGEQDVRDATKRVAAVGTQLRLSERNRLYARHEFISSLDGPYALSNNQRSYNTVFGLASGYMKQGDVFSEYRMRDAWSGREAEAAIGLRNQWSIARGVRLSTGLERLHALAGFDRKATAASAGLEYTRSPRLKGTGRVEWRHDPSSDSWLSTAGIAQKLSRDWTLLAKNYYQLTVPTATPRQVQDRFSMGGAYRASDTNRFNLLSRYEFRLEDTLGLALGTRTDRQVHIVSTHMDLHPVRAWTLSGQHAAKWVDDRTDPALARFRTQLVSGRIGYDVATRLDVGALTSVMWSADGGRRTAVGGEVGFKLRDNLWLSLGYNATGFTDRDLVSSNYTTRGAFVRLRMKVDEDFGRGAKTSSRSR